MLGVAQLTHISSLGTTTDVNTPSEKSSPASARKTSDLPASAPRSTQSSQAPYTLAPVVDASAEDEQDDDTADDSLRLAPEMGTDQGRSSANTSRSPSPGAAEGAEQHHKHGDHKKHKKHKRNKQTPHHHAHHQHK